MTALREQVVDGLKELRSRNKNKKICDGSKCADWERCNAITDGIICGKPDDCIEELANQILSPLTAIGIEVDK